MAKVVASGGWDSEGGKTEGPERLYNYEVRSSPSQALRVTGTQTEMRRRNPNWAQHTHKHTNQHATHQHTAADSGSGPRSPPHSTKSLCAGYKQNLYTASGHRSTEMIMGQPEAPGRGVTGRAKDPPTRTVTLSLCVGHRANRVLESLAGVSESPPNTSQAPA